MQTVVPQTCLVVLFREYSFMIQQQMLTQPWTNVHLVAITSNPRQIKQLLTTISIIEIISITIIK